jgi:hypothetical protein
MLAFLTLGGPVIETFALAILLGVIFGTYSTIWVASPTILVMEDLQPFLSKVFTPVQAGLDAAAEAEPASASEERRQARESGQPEL